MKPHKTPSLKPLFLKRMQELLQDKEDYNNYLNILRIPPVKSIRCNTLKISPDDLRKKLEDKNWKISQPWKNNPEVMIVEGKIAHSQSSFEIKTDNKTTSRLDNLVINKSSAKKSDEVDFEAINREQSESKFFDLEPGELGRALEHLLGYYYIQELSSMLPIIALKPEENELILDLCSAPGSKTTQLASGMQNTGTIIANEISLGRLKILASNLERCGVTNTIITRKEGVELCKRLAKQNIKFNHILIDAPCSGEGTLRSSPKTYAMWNIKTITNLSKIQKNIVSSSLDILKIGGKIIYSTCTHAPEENEEVVDFILKRFKGGVTLEKINLPIKHREGITKWQDKTYSKEVKKCARIYPHDNNTEGFFIAKFRRVR